MMAMELKRTLVIGASENPERNSYLAVIKLQQNHHPVFALGIQEGFIRNVPIQVGQPPITDLDTVTLYIRPEIQKNYYDYILGLHPKRIIFNPGTENDIFCKRAEKLHISCINACTLVLLATYQY
jgi:predicted CoA-binding protein